MYISHINAKNEEQSCTEHCYGTAEKAEMALKSSGLGKSAYLAGLLHDMGKFTTEFDEYIRKAVQGNAVRGSVIHSFAGVSYLLRHHHTRAKNSELTIDDICAEILCVAIGSHHGLIDCYDRNGISAFIRRLIKQPEYDLRAEAAFLSECMSKEKIDALFSEAVKEMSAKLQSMADAAQNDPRKEADVYFYTGVLARLITSAVVDADRTDTAEFMTGTKQTHVQANPEIWQKCLSSLTTYISRFRNDDLLCRARNDFSNACELFGSHGCGIYRLDLPTGGGKTLSALRFALAHSIKHNKKRIIYTAPLLSIIEQNAKVIRNAIDDDVAILEHHSNVINDDNRTIDKLELTELMQVSWNAPVIITTLVRMLDVFFSCNMADVRRFSALCDSVIIFDEVQSLPEKAITMFNLTVNFLAEYCNTTVVLCSATQPEFAGTLHAMHIAADSVIDKQLLRKYASLFKRTNLVDSGTMGLEDIPLLAEKVLMNSRSLLIVCNTKAEANYLFNEAANLMVRRFHLSAGMCSAHRRRILNALYDALGDKEAALPVLCISTQVIEAGIDISFENVIRISAGLDSIVQAAGRCNRNGEYNTKDVYIVRIADERLGPLKQIAEAQNATNDLLTQFKKTSDVFDNDIASDSAVMYYYRRLYGQMKEGAMDYAVNGEPTLFSMLSENNTYKVRGNETGKFFMEQAFKTAGMQFKVFDDETETVLVPYDEGSSIITALESQRGLNDIAYAQTLISRSGDYCVTVYSDVFKRLQKSGAIRNICGGSLYVLNADYYNESTGILSERDIKEGKMNCSIQIL